MNSILAKKNPLIPEAAKDNVADDLFIQRAGATLQTTLLIASGYYE